jgi:hypothetical protein
MNLIDAVKSGRPWKEKGGTHLWLRLVKSAYLGLAMDLTEKEWEIQEPEVKITRAQFWEAASVIFGRAGVRFDAGLCSNLGNTPAAPWVGPSVVELARRLGLEEP